MIDRDPTTRSNLPPFYFFRLAYSLLIILGFFPSTQPLVRPSFISVRLESPTISICFRLILWRSPTPFCNWHQQELYYLQLGKNFDVSSQRLYSLASKSHRWWPSNLCLFSLLSHPSSSSLSLDHYLHFISIIESFSLICYEILIMFYLRCDYVGQELMMR